MLGPTFPLSVTTTMAQTGLLSWCNDIRRSMASDQGRQTFSDRIQKDGFLFLDDYLDNILAGARQEYVASTVALGLELIIS